MSKLDWTKVASELPERKTARIQCADLSQKDFYWLKVAAKLKNRSMADDAASILTCAVRRLSPEWEELLIFQAAQEGITPEELFVRLSKS